MSEQDPKDIALSQIFTRADLLELSETNAVIDKQCFWLPAQMFAVGFEFKTDGPFENEKFGNSHTFDTFKEYLEWSGAMEELVKDVSFSSLYGIAINVGFNDDVEQWLEGPNKYFGPLKVDAQGKITNPVTEIKSYYPRVDNSGYVIHKKDEDGDPEVYKITVTNRNHQIEMSEDTSNNVVVFYVHASRVTRFPAFQKNLSISGTPKPFLTGTMAKMQQTMIENVIDAAKNLSAPYAVRRVANKEEMEELMANEDSDQISRYSNIWVIGGDGPLSEKIQLVVPDMKAEQFAKFYTTINKWLSTASNLSLRNFGEEDIASGLGEGGAQFSMSLLKSEILSLQKHYKSKIEHVFYLMGKEDTDFTWNEPMLGNEQENVGTNGTESNSESSGNSRTNGEELESSD